MQDEGAEMPGDAQWTTLFASLAEGEKIRLKWPDRCVRCLAPVSRGTGLKTNAAYTLEKSVIPYCAHCYPRVRRLCKEERLGDALQGVILTVGLAGGFFLGIGLLLTSQLGQALLGMGGSSSGLSAGMTLYYLLFGGVIGGILGVIAGGITIVLPGLAILYQYRRVCYQRRTRFPDRYLPSLIEVITDSGKVAEHWVAVRFGNDEYAELFANQNPGRFIPHDLTDVPHDERYVLLRRVDQYDAPTPFK
jgi:hypothetical protein